MKKEKREKKKKIKYEIIMGVEVIAYGTSNVKQEYYKISDELLEVDSIAYSFAASSAVYVKWFTSNDEVETELVGKYQNSARQKFYILDLKKIISSTDDYLNLPLLTYKEIDKYFENN